MNTGILIFEIRIFTKNKSNTLEHRSELQGKRDVIIDTLQNELGYKIDNIVNGTYIVLDEK